jgi:tetratricopeptide (TPR) repeat protein
MNSELQTLVSLDTLANIPDEAAQEINSLLRSGIEAAKNGSRDEAKALLFRVTDIDPDNEMAWLWLASVSEYPEELLTFLQKVLNINPENEQALEWEKSTKALLARNLVQYGITAVQENKKESAKRCFLRALETDENNEMAWLWMASITEDQDEKTGHLEKVLAINPENEVAGTLLKLQRKDEAQELLQKSRASAVRGDRHEALEMLEQIKQLDSDIDEVWILQAHLSESFEEKALCFNQELACNPDNEVARFGLASLESILQAVNGNGSGNGHSNGNGHLLSPELEEELSAPIEVAEAENVERRRRNVCRPGNGRNICCRRNVRNGSIFRSRRRRLRSRP